MSADRAAGSWHASEAVIENLDQVGNKISETSSARNFISSGPSGPVAGMGVSEAWASPSAKKFPGGNNNFLSPSSRPVTPRDPQNLIADNALRLWGAIGIPDAYSPTIYAEDVEIALSTLSGPVVVRLNSGGGSLGEGLKIWAILKQHPTPKLIVIDSIAASAASIIAMAGDQIVMRTGARMMIHRPRRVAIPLDQARAMAAAGSLYRMDIATNFAADMVAVYADRTGLSRDAIEAMLDAEKFMPGDEAVRLGFADQADVLEWRTSAFLADFDAPFPIANLHAIPAAAHGACSCPR